MNRNIKFAALGSLCVFSVTLFSGCQSVSDQLGQKIAEKAIESATGGQVKMDTNTGNVKIKTDTGEMNMNVNKKDNSVVVTGSDGTSVYGGGDTRPGSAPADLPNLDGATGFSWAGSSEGGMFSYSFKTGDFKEICKKQMDLLTAAGWALKTDFSLDMGTSTMKSLENTTSSLSLTCSTNSDNGEVTVIMMKGKK